MTLGQFILMDFLKAPHQADVRACPLVRNPPSLAPAGSSVGYNCDTAVPPSYESPPCGSRDTDGKGPPGRACARGGQDICRRGG
jgi:hypothetical protein